MLADAEYENGTLSFERGQTLVIASDAVSEAEDQAGVPFGSDRMRDIVAEMERGIATDCLPDKVLGALDNWREGRPLEDDLTIVVLERT